MEKQLGRLMRNIGISRMNITSISEWEPPVDVYETENEVIVFMEISGIAPEKIKLAAEPRQLTISGERICPIEAITCIHQLEIEYGYFERSIHLPTAIDVNSTSSECKNGFLFIRMPLADHKGKIQIDVK